MVNFKQIAVDCLAGKLSGTFVLRNGIHISSKDFIRNDGSRSQEDEYPYAIYYNNEQYTYTTYGYIYSCRENSEHREHLNNEYDIVNFIPDMKKQIMIDIPEGMEAIQETVDGEIRIKFVKKEQAYSDIYDSLCDRNEAIDVLGTNDASVAYNKKEKVLRKLINIRNHFGKPQGIFGYVLTKSGYPTLISTSYADTPVFKTKEDAEKAFRLLGDEVKYIFEPW